MQAKAVFAILLLLTLSSLSWANTEKKETAPHDSATEASFPGIDDLVNDVIDFGRTYSPMATTKKNQEKLQAAVDAAEKKLPEIEKIEDLLKKNEARSTWTDELLTAYFDFAGLKSGEPLKRALNIALPDKPDEDKTKKREIQETVKGMQSVWASLTPEQRKVFKAMRDEKGPKASAEDLGKLAYALKTMAAQLEEKRNKENDGTKIKKDTITLKALKALEPLFASKIFAALDKEYKEAKDKTAYIKNQQNKGAWDIAREWAGAAPETEVAIAFDPQIKKLADAKATAAKEKELAKSPVRKTASTEPGAIPSTDAKPVPKKVQVSFSGPKGNEWVEGVQKEDGLVHVTVNYPAGVYSTAKSVDVVHTYKKASMPKDVKVTQSPPVAVYGPGINKSFPTVLINNEPYIVTADGYTHYKFVDFFGNGQQQPPQQAPTPKPQVAAAAPQPPQAKSEVKVTASVKGGGSAKVDASVSARAGEATPLVVQTSVKVETPSLEAVTVQELDFKNSGSAMVREGAHRKAYESSLRTARAAIAGKLKDVQWEEGEEPRIIDTKEGPVLAFKGWNGPDLVVGVMKNEEGKYVPLGDCLNCGNIEYRKLDVFNTHTEPLPKIIEKNSEPKFFEHNWEILKTKLPTLASAQKKYQATPPVTTAHSQVAAAATPTAETPTTPVAIASPIFIQPVDVSTVAFGYRAPQTYFNPTAPTSGVQTASNTATSSTQGKRLVRKVVSSYCRLCNNGAGGYIQRYVDVWE